MCSFCHVLYTLCEDAKIYDTALTQQQFALLLRQVPSFVAVFDQWTVGFDWDGERERISTRRKNAGMKRKRDDPEADGLDHLDESEDFDQPEDEKIDDIQGSTESDSEDDEESDSRESVRESDCCAACAHVLKLDHGSNRSYTCPTGAEPPSNDSKQQQT